MIEFDLFFVPLHHRSSGRDFCGNKCKVPHFLRNRQN